MRDNDIVKVTCYGKTETYKRKDAIDFFQEGVCCSEGSEQERYVTILIGLMSGLTEVTDTI